MRLSILLFITLMFFSCGQNDSVEKESTSKKDIDSTAIINPPAEVNDTTSSSSPIQQIRDEYAKINSLAAIKKQFDFVCDAEGKVIYFTYNNEIVKVVVEWGFVGDGASTVEYYYKNGRLFFEYEVYIGMPPSGEDVRIEYRTYVENDKVIRYMENDKILPCKTCNYKNTDKAYKIINVFSTGNIEEALCPKSK